MAKANKSNISKVNEKQLKADIKAMKAAKTKEEVDAILAKYEAALDELENGKKPEAKKPEVKKPAPVPAPAPVKKEEPKKEEAPKKKEDKKSAGRQYNGKYEVFQTGDGWAYDLKASNGEILVSSEIYSSKDGVLSAIDAIKRNVEDGDLTIYDDKHGKYQFKLTAKNHRVIAISANYDNEARAQRASESFKKFALKADIVEIEAADAASKEDTPINVNKRAAAKTGGKFVIAKEDKKFSWSFRASNGQILAQADGYSSVAATESAIEAFTVNVLDGSFKCSEDKMGRFFFKLYSPSGRVVLVGESYQAKSSAENAAQTLVSLIKKAEVEGPEEQ